MSDILTQIQDELDMLLNQMQSSFAYIRVRAPPANIPGQPVLSSLAEHQHQAALQANPNNPNQPPAPEPPVSQEQYRKDIAELSRDMVFKEKQIEALIAGLPGLQNSEAEQMRRMKELEKELEELEGERIAAVKEREALVKKVEDKIVRAGKVASG